MCGVALPEPPGESPHVPRHRRVKVEPRQPAEGPVSEHPLCLGGGRGHVASGVSMRLGIGITAYKRKKLQLY